MLPKRDSRGGVRRLRQDSAAARRQAASTRKACKRHRGARKVLGTRALSAAENFLTETAKFCFFAGDERDARVCRCIFTGTGVCETEPRVWQGGAERGAEKGRRGPRSPEPGAVRKRLPAVWPSARKSHGGRTEVHRNRTERDPEGPQARKEPRKIPAAQAPEMPEPDAGTGGRLRLPSPDAARAAGPDARKRRAVAATSGGRPGSGRAAPRRA